MKLLKKNQVIIYTIAVLLMVAGYLNYSTNTGEALEASANEVANTANIGDARLVSTDPVDENAANELQNTINVTNTSNTNTTAENITNNTTTNTTTQTSSTVSTDDYFAKSKLERDTMYSQMLETYENVLNSDNSLETQKQSATEEITKINNTKNSIMVCENLLKTKGFDSSVIFVNGDSISVIIGADELTQEEIAQVQNIISREMSADIQNIHISTK